MMQPIEFVNKWTNTALGELQSGQAHFLDVCRLMGVEMPGGDGRTQTGETFVFEQPLQKAGGHGRADVYYENHFAIEYKSADKYPDLNAAYQQLLQYRENLRNPPLLVVTDINHWEIHTNFPNTQKRVYAFRHGDIASDPQVRAWLEAMFRDPMRLHPRRNTEQVTKEAAAAFQLIADNMREWEADPRRIAYFLTKLVFCLFAEDVGLLPSAANSPGGIFSHIIEEARGKPGVFKQYVRNLFVAMNEGGEILMRDIPYFNGTLFKVVTVEELSVEALEALAQAARLNWAAIEPTIFGALFERSLDPDKRAQLGAHYTSRADILLIIEPVLMQPLRYEWDTVQLEAADIRERYEQARTGRAKTNARNQLINLRERILARIRKTTVLDPACGSGNFLYVALQMLMDLEKEVIQHPLWAGLQMPAPEVHPRQMYGIELDPIAQALASIVVWIGYIQWRGANGYGQAFKEPFLEELEDNIVWADAILPPVQPPIPRPLPPQGREGELSAAELTKGEKSPLPLYGGGGLGVGVEKWDIPPELERRMQAVARELRRNPTNAEAILWQAIRKRQLDGRKFRRQVAIGAFVVDFYCSSERVAVEVDGPIHDRQQEADRLRQELIESLGIRFVRLANSEVENRLPDALNKIRAAFYPHPPAPGSPRKSPPFVGGRPKMREGELGSGELANGDESPLPLHGGGGLGVGVNWPEVDVIVGNPPFLGGSKMRGELGDEYYERLTEFYDGRLPGFADLVCYWFEKAREQIENGKAERAGLLATNSIRGGANREVLKRIKESGDIFMAWSDRPWILDGAAVRVSMIGFDKAVQDEKMLDGLPARTINSDLTATVNLPSAHILKQNSKICLRADEKGGAFDISNETAMRFMSASNSSGKPNSDVLYKYLNATDIVRGWRGMWIIDFGVNATLNEAMQYELPFQHVEQHVKPVRATNRVERLREKWWLHRIPGGDMRREIAKIPRFIVTPRVAKHRVFIWVDHAFLPDSATYIIARDDDYFFGVLHSKLHETWSLRMGTWLGKGNDPRYTPTTTFETFPFPWSPGAEDESCAAHAAISAAAAQLHEERDAWLNPTPTLGPIQREGLTSPLASSQEPSSPSLLVGEGAGGWGAKELKDRTLTNLYNALQVFRKRDSINTKPAARDFAPRLDELHRALDEAVCDAYGWEYDVLDDEEEILRRLLALNLERAG